MYIYVLDEDFVESGMVIDTYQSLVWTERFGDLGEFELVMKYDRTIDSNMTPGRILSTKESNRLMVVESISEDRDDSGVSVMTYTGPSFEAILDQRVAYSIAVSSYKSRMNDLVTKSLIEGVHSAKDKIAKLKQGTNVLYAASTMPPPMDRLGSDQSGWVNVHDVHKDAAGHSSIGYRIVRDPVSKDIFYDNYTGTDRSQESDFPEPTLEWGFENPYFLETQRDVVVWKNLAKNSGMTSLQAPLIDEEKDFGVGGSSSFSTEEAEYSQSGSGVKITPDDGSASAAYLNSYRHPTQTKFEGKSWDWRGRTLTISAAIEILKVQTGTINSVARRISVRYYDANNSSIGSDDSGTTPNTVGVHKCSVTFTIPSNAVKWDVRLMNGSTNSDEEVIWSDLTVVELPSNPVGYFDGEYSPDEDLTPAWTPHGNSVLLGKEIQGVVASNNCVLIQSKFWGRVHGVSARMIRNSPVQNNGCYVELKAKRSVSKASVYVYQDTVFPTGKISGNHFKALALGTSVTSTGPGPNVTGETKLEKTVSTPTQNIYLDGEFGVLGGSLYWDELIATTGSLTDLPTIQPVIFAEHNDDFVASQTFRSIQDYKTVAYVTHGETLVEVDQYSEVDPLLRRIIWVDANSLELTGEALLRKMDLMGTQAIKEHQDNFLIDGRATSFSRYEYDKDYFLGDMVLVGNHRGEYHPMRITEYIFVMDGEGFRSYPTFSEEDDAVGGVWYSPEYNINWDDVSGTWSEQP